MSEQDMAGVRQWTGANAQSLLASSLRPRVTVSDIERLAKAGVKMDWTEVRDQVIPDPPRMAPETDMMPRPLADLIWDRYRRTLNNTRQNLMTAPFQLFAAEHEEKVYVFVAPYGEQPLIIEDERIIFPSDALIAKLALLEKTTT